MGKPVSSINLDAAGIQVKKGRGRLLWYYLFNTAASVRFVKLYDLNRLATEADIPFAVLPIPIANGSNCEILPDKLAEGLEFENGLAVRATTGVANSDTGNPGANEVIVNFLCG